MLNNLNFHVDKDLLIRDVLLENKRLIKYLNRNTNSALMFRIKHDQYVQQVEQTTSHIMATYNELKWNNSIYINSLESDNKNLKNRITELELKLLQQNAEKQKFINDIQNTISKLDRINELIVEEQKNQVKIMTNENKRLLKIIKNSKVKTKWVKKSIKNHE